MASPPTILPTSLPPDQQEFTKRNGKKLIAALHKNKETTPSTKFAIEHPAVKPNAQIPSNHEGMMTTALQTINLLTNPILTTHTT